MLVCASSQLNVGTLKADSGALKTAGQFIEPSDNLNLKDYHYVGTHNSHVNERFFKTVYQQRPSITEQLNFGVRGLMLDTYNWPSNMDIASVKYGEDIGTNVVLSHSNPGFTAFTQKGFTSFGKVEYQTFRNALQEIFEYVRTHPQAFIFVLLENYADLSKVNTDIKNLAEAAKKTWPHLQGADPVFKPSDWPEAPKTWPTLGWLRQHHKSLMFTDLGDSREYIWYEHGIILENMYSALAWGPLADMKRLCTTRGGPQNSLSIFNHFSGQAVTRLVESVKNDHTYDLIKKLYYSACPNYNQGHGFLGYYGDRIVDAVTALKKEGKKTVFDFMNERNAEKAAKAAKVQLSTTQQDAIQQETAEPTTYRLKFPGTK